MPVRVVPKLHDGDEELIRKCAKELVFPDADLRPRRKQRCDVFVRPLGRWGYTDSRLYRVAFNQEQSRPFVIKTDLRSEMDKEAKGLREATNLRGTESAKRYPRRGPCEAILYPLIAPRGSVEDITELGDVMYAVPRAPRQLSPVKLLQSLYDIVALNNATIPRRINYGREYRRYLREKSRSRKLLDPLSDFFPEERSMSRHGGLTLRNPRRILNEVKMRTLDTRVRHVHGDLHPKNVLIDDQRNPNMIDFAYGSASGHWVKDFVLMECSVRFVEPPRLLQAEPLRYADHALLREDGTDEMREIANNSSTRTAEVLNEMAALVETIRSKCRECHPGYDFDEYLTAMYLILMGCIRLAAYQDFRVMLALCDLTNHLEERLVAA